jgi:hypothetical protein
MNFYLHLALQPGSFGGPNESGLIDAPVSAGDGFSFAGGMIASHRGAAGNKGHVFAQGNTRMSPATSRSGSTGERRCVKSSNYKHGHRRLIASCLAGVSVQLASRCGARSSVRPRDGRQRRGGGQGEVVRGRGGLAHRAAPAAPPRRPFPGTNFHHNAQR